MKPWPFFMYRSRIDANCSVPAVSRISSTQGELSTCSEEWEETRKEMLLLLYGSELMIAYDEHFNRLM